MKTWFLVFVLSFATFGQQTPGQLTFEVASVKPAQPPAMGRVMIRMDMDGEMLRYTNVALKDCIRQAYRLKEFQVDGPDWMDNTRFDIVAKLPEGATGEQVPEMLQVLLAERFQLKTHRETKEKNIYALLPGKNGPKLAPPETIAPAEAPPAGGPRRGVGFIQISINEGALHMKVPSATVAGFAEMISRFTEKPVVDMTEIEGQYAFDVEFAPETFPQMPGGGPRPGGPPPSPSSASPAEAAATVFDAVEKYGLKLDSRKAPIEILIVDSVSKEPTEN